MGSMTSTRKLGAIGSIPVLPLMPLAAQIKPSIGWARVHYKVDDVGHYLVGPMPAIPPSKYKAALDAIKAATKEPSYSDTGSTYYKLDVVQDPENKDRFLLKAGAVVLGFGVIDPTHEIVSTDESFEAQIGGHDDGDDLDGEDEANGDGGGPGGPSSIM